MQAIDVLDQDVICNGGRRQNLGARILNKHISVYSERHKLPLKKKIYLATYEQDYVFTPLDYPSTPLIGVAGWSQLVENLSSVIGLYAC